MVKPVLSTTRAENDASVDTCNPYATAFGRSVQSKIAPVVFIVELLVGSKRVSGGVELLDG
jgi:hypothetical protein